MYLFAEQWLAEAYQLFQPLFLRYGYELPRLRVLYGFSTNGCDQKRKHQYLGECLSSSFTQDGQVIVFITPLRVHGVDVLSVLGHELVHAVDDCNDGHGEVFKKIATDIGYEFINGVDVPTKDLLKKLEEFTSQLGPFPGIRLKNFSIS